MRNRVRGNWVFIILVALFHYVSVSFVNAQGENNNWAFGNGAGLSFNTGSPVFLKTNMYSKEGCVAISDAFGHLMFYTNGYQTWNKLGEIMPNSNGILGNGYEGSGTQAVLILKSLSNSDQYYLFTLDPIEVAWTKSPKLRYSIIDMTLNNGLGDISTTIRNVELEDEMEERMCAVEAGDCGYWIVGHKRHSNLYVTFKLTAAGLTGPVYSAGSYTGRAPGSDRGQIVISPDRSRIALSFFDGSVIETGRFDFAAGIVSDMAVLDSNVNGGYWTKVGYGLAFSSDNSKLYASVNDLEEVYQYDFSFYPNIQAIKNSKFAVARKAGSLAFRGMHLGGDGKIYIANSSAGFVSVINKPNDYGVACDFIDSGVALPPSVYFTSTNVYGDILANPTVLVHYKDTLPGKYIDTLICYADSALLSVPASLLNYVWSDGTKGASRYVHEDGMYYCLSTKECSMRMDTFHVRFVKGHIGLGADTTICPGDSLVLRVRGDGFHWQDGSTDSVYVIRNAGAYNVHINDKGCSFSDSIQVGIYQAGAFIVEGDTLICTGEELILHGVSKPGGQLVWSTGSDLDSILITLTGSYILEAENICGAFYDSVYVGVQDCDCSPFIPNAFSPNGDGANDEFKIVLDCYPQQFSFSVYNRYGLRVFISYNQDKGWNGNYNSIPADVGSYFYQLHYRTPSGLLRMYKGDLLLLR